MMRSCAGVAEVAGSGVGGVVDRGKGAGSVDLEATRDAGVVVVVAVVGVGVAEEQVRDHFQHFEIIKN